MTSPRQTESLGVALRRTLNEPADVLWSGWHWKAALLSATVRALLFLAATLRSGWRAAAGAMAVEFLLRVATTGFCGAVTQSLRHVQPAWHGAMVSLVALPLGLQVLELVLHILRGTPHWRTGLWASTVFTILSTLFHLHCTRQGAYLTGAGGTSLRDDLRRTPDLVAGFLRVGLWKG
ncbi:hypothetical protein [Paludibaculum fermentans]|uniref:Uncharacterized protein n=1 Tax=Paludibaculum fermentans TaxID=1473598 RepID=A0A7S7NUE8_PALFE|nr:hypothetical protein [Paludibaculum fermentans]QOY90017.1 hypothetical protein IRI77_08705 [Paludibaculum fermentans]